MSTKTPGLPPRNIELSTPSGATFTLKADERGDWAVIDVTRTQSAPAHAMLGMTFRVGADPYSWPQGYATLIQTAVNNRAGLHSSYGIAKAAPIITEVPIERG